MKSNSPKIYLKKIITFIAKEFKLIIFAIQIFQYLKDKIEEMICLILFCLRNIGLNIL